jgi:hypothetical protein
MKFSRCENEDDLEPDAVPLKRREDVIEVIVIIVVIGGHFSRSFVVQTLSKMAEIGSRRGRVGRSVSR